MDTANDFHVHNILLTAHATPKNNKQLYLLSGVSQDTPVDIKEPAGS